MYLDRDGTAGTYADEQIALLTGLTDLSASTLYSGGYIITEI